MNHSVAFIIQGVPKEFKHFVTQIVPVDSNIYASISCKTDFNRVCKDLVCYAKMLEHSRDTQMWRDTPITL